MKSKNVLKLIVLPIALLSLASCSTMKAELLPQSQFDVKLHASSDINPNQYGRPSPLVITFYQLKSNTQFNRADFNSLYYKTNTTLGPALISSKQTIITPGKQQEILWNLSPKTKYIGVVAAYSRLDQANWRQIVPINSTWGKTHFTINVNKDSINFWS